MPKSITWKITRLFFLCAFSLGALNTQCGKKNTKAVSKTIQVKGSDTMVNLAQAWAEEYSNIDPEVKVEVSGGGSGVGIAALIKGAIDIANASRNIKKQESELVKQNTGMEAKEFVAGFDALAIFVHKDNPIEEITLDQLKNIYAEDGTITKWSDLGISIPSAKTDKILRISRQSSSGTYEFFREHALNKKDFKLGSMDMNGSKEVVELVGNTKTAIGYSGMGYANDQVKMLKIKTDHGVFAPTVENTQTKVYPLARSLLMYTIGVPNVTVRKYIDWILSNDGQKVVEDNGYVPLATVEHAN